MKPSPRLAQKLLSLALGLLLAFSATGLAPATPEPLFSEEPAPLSSPEETLTSAAPLLSPGAEAAGEAPGETPSTEGPDAPTPETESSAPGGDTPSPQEDTPSPGTAAPSPEGKGPACGEDTPSPEKESPTPGGPAATPEEESPSPEEESPTPGEGTPSPEEESPTPGEDTSSPEEGTPVPGEETLAPTPSPPPCDLPDCPHVALDDQGLLSALCPLGEWMLAQEGGLALTPGISPMAAILPTHIALPATGTYTLYRSGTYILTGGGPSCRLVVSDNCLVALTLDHVQLEALSLGARCVAEVTFQGSSTLGALTLPGDSSVTLLGRGSLTVGAIGPHTQGVTVAGGSVSLPAGTVSANGALEFSFPAPGSTGATVNGQPYPYAQPSPDGNAHLWLPPLQEGRAYVGQMNGTILEVTLRELAPTPSDSFDLSDPGAIFAPVEGIALTLWQSGSALPQTLAVDKARVTLILSAVDAAPAPVDLNFLQEGTVHVSGPNTLGSLGGGAKVHLTGSGSLFVTDLAVGSLTAAPGLTLSFTSSSGGALSGWHPLAVSGSLTAATKATLDGKPLALAFSTASPDLALVPHAPPAGKGYSAVLDSSGVLTLKTIPLGEQTLVLAGADLRIDHDGTYRITTHGPATGNILIDPKVRATVTLLGLDSAGSLSVGRNAAVTLTLEGSSALGGGIALGQGSALTVQGGGALLTAGVVKSEGGLVDVDIKSPANLTLPAPGPIAGTGLKPTVLFISDPNGAALPNTQIVLKLGKSAPFSATTDRNGFLYLWRSAPLSSVDAVVLSDANTYATVLVGGSGDPDALPTIDHVAVNSFGTITYTASGAATSGVQYLVGPWEVSMPDTYVPQAGRVLERFGECNLPGLQSGDVVTFRVFACARPNVTLTADTADGFAFSPQYSFVVSDVRFPFSLEAQFKTYNGKKFSFASGLLPKGVSIAWFSGSKPLSDAPVQVGRYIARIGIPVGHPDFLPGVAEVDVEILPIPVLIFPEAARKVMGQPDPDEFPYTYDPGDLLPGDKITGRLIRIPGEEPGNYPYLTDELAAKPYYELEIDPDSPMFFIDFDPSHFRPYDPLAKIDPVHDVIVFSDGRRLDLITATVQKLNISGRAYGEMVTEALSGRPRPFTPSLRLRSGYDAALLILQGEPELRADGGYATDLDGNPIVTGRTLTLTYTHLEHLRRQRITHIAFGLEGAYCYLALEDLQSEALRALMAREGLPRLGSRFALTLTPITGSGAVPENAPAAQESAALRAPLAQVRLELVNGSSRLDITPALPSARLLMDVSPALTLWNGEAPPSDPEVEETVLGQSRQTQAPAQDSPEAPQGAQAIREAADTLQGRVEPTTQNLELARQTLEQVLRDRGCSLRFFTDLSHPLDSLLVVPYTFSEAQAIPYTAVLRTRPYLMAPLAAHGNGLYGLAFASPLP